MSFQKLTAALLFSAALISTPVFAADDHDHDKEETRQLDAHEHGVSVLKVAQEGNKFAFELESPGDDIVGFEKAPESEAEKASVNAAVAKLSNPSLLFLAPDAAACTASDVDAELHMDGEHAGFEAKWVYTCAKPEAMTGFSTTFFRTFPNAKEIEVQAVLAAGAVAAELTADQAEVTFATN